MIKTLISLLLLIVFTQFANAQNSTTADSLYNAALTEYDQQHISKAIEGFQKVLAINPNHLDALFNLASLTYQEGEKEKAIELFQHAAALGDKQSKNILKDKLHIRLIYTDTMNIDDVDKKPLLIVGDKTEQLEINDVLNKNLITPIVERIAKSQAIRKQALDAKAKEDKIPLNKVTGARLTLSICFGKDGSIFNQVMGYDAESRKKIQTEVDKESSHLGKVQPGEYDGKTVNVIGYLFPINFYPEEPTINTN
ncbi:tetratricopeptide repeat protein [Solitalea koreensis]|uniref:Tetratricopeptide repeat-containing protein n=1 Tax=Solitalea koreensis TaxID=543615 RepID=A0A521D1J3_9SPHI|nr:tetratricopeptide repeat protein [Solitalea koreensis]SMO65575.1 Tetratricopeptide repeat-containing protein [Solitalea koreensis]